MDSWSNLCRCCLSPEYEVSLLDDSQNVKEKFREVTSIEVNIEDGLPQMLCTECHTIMNSAYQFRAQCIKMDTELKLQLESLLNERLNKSDKESSSTQTPDNEVMNEQFNIDNESMKQLESIIKTEPGDIDDDCYYVLVIDDKEKDADVPEQNEVTNIKIEPFEEPNMFEHTEEEKQPEVAHKKDMTDKTSFENSIESFLVTHPKISDNVPDTILENEEQDNEGDENGEHDIEFEDGMDIDDTEYSPDQNYENDDSQDNTVTDIVETISDIKGVSNSQNIIKILATTGEDGTIVLKGEDGIQYLTDADLVGHDGGDDQEEIIFYEGDDDSQYRVLKSDGSELVIMQFADEGQIATVMQQEDGSFLCDCGESFADLSEYEKHQYQHNPAGENLCNLCGKGFETPEILTGHLLLHNVTGPQVNCPFCVQSVKRNTLTQHIKYVHNSKPQCEICSKTFANLNNLKRHQLIHRGIRDFECDICFKRFHQKITMQTHRLTHLNPLACNQCEMSFENTTQLTKHKESEECSKSKILRVKEELMKTVKKEITTNLGKLIGYACSLCKKMFSIESALEQHIENTHMIDPTELLCSECGEVLPSKKEMQTHMLIHKNVKGKNAKRFECSSCGKGCTSQAMLIMHERVHTNERPFPCQLCSLRFKTKTHLRTHQLTHTRERKFGCSVCMKFFALKGNLVVHLRTHTGERPYVCSLCGEAFIDSKYLKKHKLKKHAIDNVPWNQY